jgi:hypothetical protein
MLPRGAAGAPDALAEWEEFVDAAPGPGATTLAEALAVRAIRLPLDEKPLRLDVAPGDPILRIGDGGTEARGAYERLAIRSPVGERVYVEVVCNSRLYDLGRAGTVVQPQLLAADDAGNSLETRRILMVPRNANWTLNAHVVSVWELVPNTERTQIVLVASSAELGRYLFAAGHDVNGNRWNVPLLISPGGTWLVRALSEGHPDADLYSVRSRAAELRAKSAASGPAAADAPPAGPQPGQSAARTAESAALAAVAAHEAWCADVRSASDEAKAADATAEVAAAWREVDVALEMSREPYLLYWRGLLAECLRHPDRALGSLREFVTAAGDDPSLGALVQDAERRIRRLDPERTP